MLQRYRARRAAHKELMAKLDNLTDPTLIQRMWHDYKGLHYNCRCVIIKIGA